MIRLRKNVSAASYAGRIAANVTSVSDHFEGLARSLLSNMDGDGGSVVGKAVGVASLESRAGASTIAAHLAAAAAADGRDQIALVDAHLARPSVSSRFRQARSAGFAEWLEGVIEMEDCLICVAPQNLSVIGAGLKPRVRGVFQEETLGPILGRLRGRFDLTVFDLPPADGPTAADGLSRMLDGILLVIEAERVRRETAVRTVRKLREQGVHILGAVLNKRPDHIPDWLYRRI